MANFDVMTFTSTGTAKAITADLVATSFVRSSGATARITALSITPRADNAGDAMYWGRSTVTKDYGERLVRGVTKALDFDGGSISVADIYMVGDVAGDQADIVFTLE